MEDFSPEFSALWRAEKPSVEPAVKAPSVGETPTEQDAALEELADRINAARSIA
ncbi:MAG: hypothetical protein ABI981_00205 [Betaproteobacteria bacterium]